MELQEYINAIKLELTGNILHLELTDTDLAQVVNESLREIQKFIDTTKIMTIPYSRCIDLKDSNVSSVSRVFRAEGYLANDPSTNSQMIDPMFVQQWQILTGGGVNMYNLNDWVLNFASWNTMLQLRNTTSTDLAFKQDMDAKKLYINCAYDFPKYITIEYIPIYKNVNEVTNEYWIDIILRMSVALTKIIVGRIRSRYTQSNALWSQDGERLLEEGNEERNTLRETLRINSQIIYPID